MSLKDKEFAIEEQAKDKEIKNIKIFDPPIEKFNKNEILNIQNSPNDQGASFHIFNYNNFNILDLQNLDEKTLFSKNNILMSFNNQKMTKYLQKNLINISKVKINYIIDELKGAFREIIKNKNGNYFCSNLINICDKNNRIKILIELSDTLSEDCMDEFGTYPIQNLIEHASSEDEFKLLLKSFNEADKILLPALNQHGTFVIQKLIRHIPEKIRVEFNLIIVQFVSILSRDKYGAYAIEKFILYTKNEQIQKQILNLIMADFINISTNKNGNYLIQHLLEKWWNNKKGENLKKLINSKYQILSKNIYSYYICQLYNKLLNDKKEEKESE